jgi:hypothetical protein
MKRCYRVLHGRFQFGGVVKRAFLLGSHGRR